MQAIDKIGSFSLLDIATPMYTMAHRLLRLGKDFRRPGVQSAMANLKPPFPFRIRMPPLPHLPIELIPDRGRA
jgi:hypothetical protein